MSTLNGGPGNIVTNGLVLYLDAANYLSYTSGSTTWRDLSSSNLSGSLINGPTYSSTNAGSIVFDGVDDYVSCPPLTSSIDPNNGITLNYFVKISNRSKRNILLSNYTTSSPFPGITGEIGTSAPWTNGLRWQVASNTSTAKVDIYVSNVIQNNTVYFVTFTFDFTTKTSKIYLNGVEQSTTSRSINPNNVTTNWIQNVNLDLAADVTNSLFYLGNIYNAQIYNRALTASEVLQNYNATKARFGL
jgi:hypothetical protein